ncbi:cell envelope biogenesis protein TolA [Bradyrhizobium diazoefficiens]|uniref:cell envelope biogenesis protein TolA n=1 Tax=Bradyrhizobium diazoefficiens TaxID=1355477 RepID=UPI00272B86CE|nr:cell envelope biogenesis protein TolA [Bradyrhizobium diazoefficiens]WLA69371.1 cell envelope biogenesis protein TolA [Bradyrhizobium diazoefficiens]
MPRKLRTFQTSLGFYDLAVAVPSMKAALEAWGAGSNLFHQGFAKETSDPDVLAVTMLKPGVVLKRPAGSSGRFAEHAELPSDIRSGEGGAKREKRRLKPAKKIGEREARKAAVAFEKEQERQKAQRRREEAAREKERERREKATAKAQSALDAAERQHADKAESIRSGIEALEKQAQVEEDRWEKERERLRAALRKARE